MRPVAFCPACLDLSLNPGIIGQPCLRLVKGVRCSGIYQGRPDAEGWRECSSCQGAGTVDGTLCHLCNARGWFLARPPPKY